MATNHNKRLERLENTIRGDDDIVPVNIFDDLWRIERREKPWPVLKRMTWAEFRAQIDEVIKQVAAKVKNVQSIE